MATLTLEITTTEKGLGNEKRYSSDITVAQLKDKLYPLTGIAPETAKLKVLDSGGNLLFCLDNDALTLAQCNVANGARIHVIDTDPNSFIAGLQDVSKVEKFVMDDKDYDQRTDSVRNFLKSMPKKQQAAAPATPVDPDAFKDAAAALTVGDRALVKLSGGFKTATIKFVGKTEFKPGYWVGVEYDGKEGKHSGIVAGKQYFDAKPGHGAFVRPDVIMPDDIDDDDLDEL